MRFYVEYLSERQWPYAGTGYQILPGSWINLCDPNEKENRRVCAQLHVDPDLVRAALDEEERSRIEVEDNGHILIIVDTPIGADRGPQLRILHHSLRHRAHRG